MSPEQVSQVRRIVAASSVGALAAGLLYGATVPTASAEDSRDGDRWSALVDRAANEAIVGIETVGPIATVAGTSGDLWPAMPGGVAVMPRGTVLSGAFPSVYIPALKDVEGIDVRVRELSSPRPEVSVVYEGSANAGWFTVGKTLKPGAEYGVDVRKGSGEWASVGTFNVSLNGDAGPVTNAGGISISEVTGRASWSWNSPALPGPTNAAVIGLAWTSGADSSPGLPAGWRLAATTGSPWMGLEESPVDAVAVDVPVAPAASRSGAKVIVDFAYPAQETLLVDRFVIQGQTRSGAWKVLARPGRAFASPDVDAVVPADAARSIQKMRVGAVVEGTTIWGPAAPVRGSVPPVTSEPRERELPGAEPGSLATPGDLPSVVRLFGWDGGRLTFIRNAMGVYEQVGGQTAGFANGLTWIADGEWEFAALDGTVTRFVDGRAVSVQVKGARSATMTWSQSGRLTSLTNEVGHTIMLRYSGDAQCPSWSKFASVPRGMLCALTYPGSRVTQIGYVDAGDGAQISLIKDPGNVGETLGWDDRGRLVSTRSSIVNRIATFDPAVAGVVTSVLYDGQGRAATLMESPATVGGSPLTKTLDFPSVTPAGLRAWVMSGNESDAAIVTVRSVGGGYDLQRVKTLDPIAWQPLRITAPYGLDTSVDRSARSGQTSSAVDPVGRTTSYRYDELGQVTSVEGPVTGSGDGPVTSSDYDTKKDGGRDVALSGLRAQVYSRDSYGGAVTAEFWESDYTRGGLSYAWSGRGAKFSAQASGVWTPPANDDGEGSREGWDFQVQASGGSDVSLVIGGVVCAASGTLCHVDGLPKGPKAVTVQVSDAPSDGWFSISAAPAGQEPRLVRYDDLRPGFGLTTVSTSNDDLPGGTDVTRTDYAFSDLSQAQVSTVRAPGGLVTRLTYEESAEGNGSWGRLLTRTTPGGQKQTTTYWPDKATVSLPAECGAESVTVSGQPKSVTRQDGTTVTAYFDIQGRQRATVSAGGSITETLCTQYREDGSMLSSAAYVNGALLESTVVEQAVGGDPRVARTTITHGPASTSPGVSRSRTSTIDLLGRVVTSTGLAGETVTTTYDAVGNVARTVTTPPEGSRSAPLRFDYTYDPQSTLLLTTSVNGVLAAEVSRDPSSGLTTSIDYAGAATVGLGYSPSGRVSERTVTTNAAAYSRIVDQYSMTPSGRITGRNTTVAGTDASSVEVGYVYDSAGRLVRANYSGDDTATFAYEFASSQASSCEAGYSGAALDALRTGGARNGAGYFSCYDSRGRQVSTSDPTIAGPGGVAEVTHDGLGRVTGISGPRALAAQWSAGTQLARLDEIAADGSGLVSTRLDSFGGSVLEKTLVTDEGSSTVRFADEFVLAVQDGVVTGTSAVQYALPGGASVMTAPGATATLTVPGIDGSALVRVDVPALGLGGAAAPGASPGVVASYGPYGEPLIAPSIAGASPVPTYGWRAAEGRETLPGASSVVLMGARPYHPGLGAFLASDPLIDSGDNLYSYTGGDPVNAQDASGQEEQVAMIAAGIIAGVALLGSFGAGYMMGKFAARGRQFAATTAKVFGYVGIGVATVGAGAATYLAVQGQTADIGIAVGAAIGAAAVSTIGTGLFARWGVSRAERLMVARAKNVGIRSLFEQVEKGRIHPDVAPIAAEYVRGLPFTDPARVVDDVNQIIKAARAESAKLDQMIILANKRRALVKELEKRSGLLGIEEVSEVSSVAGQL